MAGRLRSSGALRGDDVEAGRYTTCCDITKHRHPSAIYELKMHRTDGWTKLQPKATVGVAAGIIDFFGNASVC